MPALVGHQGGELRGGLRAEEQLDVPSACSQSDAPARPPPGWRASRRDQVDGLAHGQDEEEPPEVVAVLEPGELPPLGAAVEAVEGGEGDVLLVGQARRAAEPARARATRRWK